MEWIGNCSPNIKLSFCIYNTLVPQFKLGSKTGSSFPHYILFISSSRSGLDVYLGSRSSCLDLHLFISLFFFSFSIFFFFFYFLDLLAFPSPLFLFLTLSLLLYPSWPLSGFSCDVNKSKGLIPDCLLFVLEGCSLVLSTFPAEPIHGTSTSSTQESLVLSTTQTLLLTSLFVARDGSRVSHQKKEKEEKRKKKKEKKEKKNITKHLIQS